MCGCDVQFVCGGEYVMSLHVCVYGLCVGVYDVYMLQYQAMLFMRLYK